MVQTADKEFDCISEMIKFVEDPVSKMKKKNLHLFI